MAHANNNIIMAECWSSVRTSHSVENAIRKQNRLRTEHAHFNIQV